MPKLRSGKPETAWRATRRGSGRTYRDGSASGLIDDAAGAAILRDAEAHERRSISFGSILAVMAALLLGAAILIFVAANWEAIPRLTRVGALFAIIAAGYIGGAALKLYDHAAIGEALWLVAAAAFGAAIALIGQMYHLAGDETRGDPRLVRRHRPCRGGVAFRPADGRCRRPRRVLAVLARGGVLARQRVSASFRRHGGRSLARLLLDQKRRGAAPAPPVDGPLRGAAGNRARRDRRRNGAGRGDAAVLFALAVLMPDDVERIVRLDGLLPVHCLLGFLAAMVLIQIEVTDESGAGFAVAAALAFAGIGAALVLFGRESRGLRWIAYAGFAVELCLVYVLMIGSMLGTAGFFLVAGVLLGVMALAIIRIEKRLRDPPALSAGAA